MVTSYFLSYDFITIASPQDPFGNANVETFDPRGIKSSSAIQNASFKQNGYSDYEKTTPKKVGYEGNALRVSSDIKSSYLQSPEVSNQEKQSHSYQKQFAFPQNKVDLSQKLHNSHFDLNKYASESKYNTSDDGDHLHQEPNNFYSNKLEAYLKTQNKSTDKFRYKKEEEKDENDPQYIYHLEDERRRIKVQSIRYYEDNFVSPLVPSKSMEIKSKSSGLPMREKSFSREERKVLGVVDRNRDRDPAIIKSTEQSLKEIMHKGGKSFSNLSHDKIERYQKDTKTDYTRTKETLESTKRHLSPMQLKRMNERQKRSASKGERPRSQTPGSPTKKVAPVKMRPLSKAAPQKTKHQKGKGQINYLPARKSCTNEYEKYNF